MIRKNLIKLSLFQVTIKSEVSCRFKAKISFINHILGYGFASLSKKWQGEPMQADENAPQACDTHTWHRIAHIDTEVFSEFHCRYDWKRVNMNVNNVGF